MWKWPLGNILTKQTEASIGCRYVVPTSGGGGGAATACGKSSKPFRLLTATLKLISIVFLLSQDRLKAVATPIVAVMDICTSIWNKEKKFRATGSDFYKK